MSDFDYAAIEVNGVFIDAWTEYTFESDMFTPADAFRLTLGVGSSKSSQLRANLANLREAIPVGGVVRLWIGHGNTRALQGTGIVDARDITNDREGTKFTVEGRDFAAYLLKSAAPLDLYASGDTFIDVVSKAVAPWGIKVVCDAAAARDVRTGKKADRAVVRRLQAKAEELGIPARKLSDKVLAGVNAGTIPASALGGISPTAIATAGNALSPLLIPALKVKEAAAQSGETVWEFLDRHAQRLGLLMRMSPDGTLVLSGIDYGQTPVARLVRKAQSSTTGTRFAGLALAPNNILSGGERYDFGNLYKEVRVYGHAKGSDIARTRFKGVARDSSDDALPYESTLIIHDNTIRTQEEAVLRAYRELAKTRQGAQVIEYKVRGHGNGRVVYAADTVVDVDDEVLGIKGSYYVVSRTFARTLADGPTTTLRIVPLGSIILGTAK